MRFGTLVNEAKTRERVALVKRQQLDIDPGGLRGKQPQQARDHERSGRVAGRYADACARACWIENCSSIENLTYAGQNIGNRRVQCDRTRSRFHGFSRNPDEQFVPERCAQARQRRAHAGLAQTDALAGAGDAALGDQCIEGHKKIQIHRGKVHVSAHHR